MHICPVKTKPFPCLTVPDTAKSVRGVGAATVAVGPSRGKMNCLMFKSCGDVFCISGLQVSCSQTLIWTVTELL